MTISVQQACTDAHAEFVSSCRGCGLNGPCRPLLGCDGCRGPCPARSPPAVQPGPAGSGCDRSGSPAPSSRPRKAKRRRAAAGFGGSHGCSWSSGMQQCPAQSCRDQQHTFSCGNQPRCLRSTAAVKHGRRFISRHASMSPAAMVVLVAHLAAVAVAAVLPGSDFDRQISRQQQQQQQWRLFAPLSSRTSSSAAAVSAAAATGGTGRALLQRSGRGGPSTAPGEAPGGVNKAVYATRAGSNTSEAGTSYNNPRDFPVPAGYE